MNANSGRGNEPPDSQRRPVGGADDRTAGRAGTPSTVRVRRLSSNPLGCPAECPLDYHECGGGQPVSYRPPCDCQGLDLDVLALIGERGERCSCSMRGAE